MSKHGGGGCITDGERAKQAFSQHEMKNVFIETHLVLVLSTTGIVK